jgi:soluble lytic murein transglycosylase-like protein
MPATGRELGLKTEEDFFNAEKNLDAGARYLQQQHRRIKELLRSMPRQRNLCGNCDYWKLALASYNGGLGYIIAAVKLCGARKLSYTAGNILQLLADPACVCRGKGPDYRQMQGYVSKIWPNYQRAINQPSPDGQ